MAAAKKIRIVFHAIHVKKAADTFGSGEFYFDATVAGRKVGDRTVFKAVKGKKITLPEKKWSIVLDGAKMKEVKIVFTGKDKDVTVDDYLGTIIHTHKRQPDWRQLQMRKGTEYFFLDWSLELYAGWGYGPSFGWHQKEVVWAARAHREGAVCTTVNGRKFRARVEVCPVRPIPSEDHLPPRYSDWLDTLVKPDTPETPDWTRASLATSSKPNAVHNPAAIPILSGTDVHPNNAAVIEVTYYRPDFLKLDRDDDPRLTWEWDKISGNPSIQFIGKKCGRRILVYGADTPGGEGEVLFKLRFKDALVATYRALVLKIVDIKYRVNILRGPKPNSRPLSTPADIINHIAIANILLRQMCLRLVPDPDTRPRYKPARAVEGYPGIFQINVKAWVTRRLRWWKANDPFAARLNFNPGVVNIVYVHSGRKRTKKDRGWIGLTTDWPGSRAPARRAGRRWYIDDRGAPSSSWARPSGVSPDMAAQPVKMKIDGARSQTRRGLCAMLIANSCGNPKEWTKDWGHGDAATYGSTIAHELGHVLGLYHRGGTKKDNPDDVLWPKYENVMYPGGADHIAQDFDIVQTRAVRCSRLLPAQQT